MLSFKETVQQTLGFEPAAIAVMGKWEPFLRAESCLEEVAARAAAALALSEAVVPEGPRPYLLSAEAWLRGQPRPGCVLAAEIMANLGADPERIRCCAGANQTWSEVQVLDRMRGKLGVDNLLLLTASYHVERTRDLLRDLRPRLSGRPLFVYPAGGELVQQALSRLETTRSAQLRQVIDRGQRNGLSLAPLAINEVVARLGRRFPAVQGIRGRPASDSPPMFRPDARGADLPPRPSEHQVFRTIAGRLARLKRGDTPGRPTS